MVLSYGYEDEIVEGRGSWKEKFKSRFNEPESLNSEQESQELSTRHSQQSLALPASSDELVDRLIDDRRAAIQSLRKDQDMARKNAAIAEHYTDEAKKVLEGLFKECGRITGHSRKNTGASSHSSERPQKRCEACGHYTGEWSDSRNKDMFEELGRQMREADKEAGIEWIPSRY